MKPIQIAILFHPSNIMVAYDSFPKGIVSTKEKLVCMFTFENVAKTINLFSSPSSISFPPFSSVSIFSLDGRLTTLLTVITLCLMNGYG